MITRALCAAAAVLAVTVAAALLGWLHVADQLADDDPDLTGSDLIPWEVEA